MRILLPYRLVQLLSLPIIVLYFALRLAANRLYWAHFGERLGFLPRRFHRTAPGAIWLHAVSVGEVASALPLIRQLREQAPRVPIFVSTTTLAGRRAAEQRLAGLAEGVFYCPLDFASIVRRVLRAIRPALVIVLETEIWPNFYSEVKRSRAVLALVNARISDRAWPHYKATKWFFAPVVRLADVVIPQSPLDRARYFRLGVPRSKLHLDGNLKYDAPAATPPVPLPTFGAGCVWIAASTVAPGETLQSQHVIDEDDVVLDAFSGLAEQFPSLLLILAPRQPARFDAVAAKLRARGLHFLRRGDLARHPDAALELPGVLLLDSIGELTGLFPLADVVFVGGSIAPRGGHNIIEPAAAGAAIVTGVHMENFEGVARDFLQAGAMVQVSAADDLGATVGGLLSDPARAHELGSRARAVVEQRRGAAARIAARLWPLYHSACVAAPRGPWSRLALKPLALLWETGGALKRRRDLHRQRRLPRPVISIGAITVGGAGKTPFVNYLASRLRLRGLQPAVLTRGYRRRTPATAIVLPPGTQIPPAVTGDEAQILLRSGAAALGIGADRFKTGQLLLSRLPADVFLLDDGFQNARLARDLDIVMIDGLVPFGYRATFPLGRLREPLSALARAGVFVVSRAGDNCRFASLCEELRLYNPRAPVFRVHTVPRRWRLCTKSEPLESLPARRVAAFCGLGNPQGFWNTLDAMDNLDVVFRWSFPDHHMYQPYQLSRLARQARQLGAELLVTTEKDRINLPTDSNLAAAGLEIAWLEIEYVLDDEPRFLELVDMLLRSRTPNGDGLSRQSH